MLKKCCLEFKGGNNPMAIAVMQDFPGGTQEQYDRITAQLNLGSHSPKGNLYHTAGPVEGGWRVVDVWESQDAFNAFVGVLVR